jgi:hypothetical protein
MCQKFSGEESLCWRWIIYSLNSHVCTHVLSTGVHTKICQMNVNKTISDRVKVLRRRESKIKSGLS